MNPLNNNDIPQQYQQMLQQPQAQQLIQQLNQQYAGLTPQQIAIHLAQKRGIPLDNIMNQLKNIRR